MSKRTRGNGVGSIYQRTGRAGWYVALSQNGKRKIYHYAPDGKPLSKSQADQVLAAAKVARERGELAMAPSQTLESYLKAWLEQVVKPARRPGTHRGYEQLVRVHIVPALGSVRVDRLTPAQLQAFINAKLATSLSPRTVQYMFAVLRAALARAVKWGIVARNVCDLVDAPSVERDEIQPFTRAEAAKLLAVSAGNRLEALYTVALGMGLRQGEALGLQWDDVDFAERQLHVRRQLLRIDHKLTLAPLKTKKATRTLTMPKVVLEALQDHRRRHIAAGLLPAGFVFVAENGSPLDSRNVVRGYKALLKRAGLPDRRFHDLRHSAGSILLAQGASPKVVQAVLGHSQFQVTANTYLHVDRELHDDAAERMDAGLSL